MIFLALIIGITLGAWAEYAFDVVWHLSQAYRALRDWLKYRKP